MTARDDLQEAVSGIVNKNTRAEASRKKGTSDHPKDTVKIELMKGATRCDSNSPVCENTTPVNPTVAVDCTVEKRLDQQEEVVNSSPSRTQSEASENAGVGKSVAEDPTKQGEQAKMGYPQYPNAGVPYQSYPVQGYQPGMVYQRGMGYQCVPQKFTGFPGFPGNSQLGWNQNFQQPMGQNFVYSGVNQNATWPQGMHNCMPRTEDPEGQGYDNSRETSNVTGSQSPFVNVPGAENVRGTWPETATGSPPPEWNMFIQQPWMQQVLQQTVQQVIHQTVQQVIHQTVQQVIHQTVQQVIHQTVQQHLQNGTTAVTQAMAKPVMNSADVSVTSEDPPQAKARSSAPRVNADQWKLNAKFDGTSMDDAFNFLAGMELFLMTHKEATPVDIYMVAIEGLTGDAVIWINEWTKSHYDETVTGVSFKRAFMDNYFPEVVQKNIKRQFNRIQQNGTLHQYIHEFRRKQAQYEMFFPPQNSADLRALFLIGLKDKSLRSGIQTHADMSIQELITAVENRSGRLAEAKLMTPDEARRLYSKNQASGSRFSKKKTQCVPRVEH